MLLPQHTAPPPPKNPYLFPHILYLNIYIDLCFTTNLINQHPRCIFPPPFHAPLPKNNADKARNGWEAERDSSQGLIWGYYFVHYYLNFLKLRETLVACTFRWEHLHFPSPFPPPPSRISDLLHPGISQQHFPRTPVSHGHRKHACMHAPIPGPKCVRVSVSNPATTHTEANYRPPGSWHLGLSRLSCKKGKM